MQAQVTQLGKVLLPRDIKKDLLEFTPRISLRALSYRLLCYAEIEHYLEERVLEIATAADKAWKERGHISRSTFCLLAFSGRTLSKLPETLSPPPSKKQVDWDDLIKPDKRLSQSISSFHDDVRNQNNGIKEKNIIALLLPIGFDPDLIDELLLSDLNDLTVKRGEAAHVSTFGQLTRGVNPRDEYDQIARIINGLKAVDIGLDALLKSAK